MNDYLFKVFLKKISEHFDNEMILLEIASFMDDEQLKEYEKIVLSHEHSKKIQLLTDEKISEIRELQKEYAKEN